MFVHREEVRVNPGIQPLFLPPRSRSLSPQQHHAVSASASLLGTRDVRIMEAQTGD